MEPHSCPEAIGLCQPDRSGHCHWCRRKVRSAAVHPTLSEQDIKQTELGLAYKYHFDPDWGTDKHDVY